MKKSSQLSHWNGKGNGSEQHIKRKAHNTLVGGVGGGITFLNGFVVLEQKAAREKSYGMPNNNGD